MSQAPSLIERRMANQDLDTVMAMEVQCYSHPWSRGNFVDCLEKPSYEAWLLEAQPSPVDESPQNPKVVAGYTVSMLVLDEWHLLNLSVAPRWRRKGLGRRLLGHVCQRALAHRAPTVLLEVRASNIAAQALYAQAGFSKDGLRKAYYPAHQGREDAVLMRMVLNEEGQHGLV